jgi:hypothetical protein
VGPRPFALDSSPIHSPGCGVLGPGHDLLGQNPFGQEPSGQEPSGQERSWHDRSCRCGRIGTAELTQP